MPTADDLSIGPLQGKIFDAGNVEVKEKDADAKWKLKLAAADAAGTAAMR